MSQRHSFGAPRMAACLLIVHAFVAPVVVSSHAKSQVAVFPFVDGTGGTNRAAGAAASQTFVDQMAAGSRLLGVLVDDSLGARAIDQERAEIRVGVHQV